MPLERCFGLAERIGPEGVLRPLDLESLGEIAIKGKREPVSAYLLVGLSAVAPAFGTRLDAPSPGAQGRTPEAPVGHRQPRPQDLPPSVLREEGGANRGGVNADRQLDQELQICKGC